MQFIVYKLNLNEVDFKKSLWSNSISYNPNEGTKMSRGLVLAKDDVHAVSTARIRV